MMNSCQDSTLLHNHIDLIASSLYFDVNRVWAQQ